VLGGFSFFQRAEVKDALAYLRLVLNPDDDIALLRTLNTPPRGIGAKTADALRATAEANDSSLWTAIENSLAARPSAALNEFRNLIAGLIQERDSATPAELLEHILDRTGYLDLLEQRDSVEDTERAGNLRELVNALAEASERGESLEEFLDRAALVSDADNFDERIPVTLTNFHCTKGLEFDHVFLAGMEDGLFPHNRSLDNVDDLEEERRLCYVGMTRAKETLTLTRAVYRRIYGNELTEASEPSRFLSEIPSELIETAEGSLAEAGESRRYEPDPEYSFSQDEFRRRARRGSSHPGRSFPRRMASSRAPQAKGGHPLLGKQVRHPTYGVGTIIGVEGDDEDLKLSISFPGRGTKKILERYGNLKPA
jgi:DNA helicase-2/ATP-dependent DNA helicase PcrA